MLTVEEVTDLLNTSKNTLTMLRETGALKAIKTGKNYMYSQEAVKRFQATFEGYSMVLNRKLYPSDDCKLYYPI